jgi:hypothetical protein
MPDFYFDGSSDDSGFNEWNVVFVTDAEAAVAQWGAVDQFRVDPEQAAILALFNAQLFRRINKQALADIDTANYQHALEISRERAVTKEASSWRSRSRGCLISTLSTRPRRPSREEAWLTHNEESHWRAVNLHRR